MQRILLNLAAVGMSLVMMTVLVGGVPIFDSAESSSSGIVVHLTDLHLDWLYKSGGDPARYCSGSSSKGNGAGIWGDFACDSPPRLVHSALAEAKKQYPNPDVIVWTGDDPPHWLDSDLNRRDVLSVISNLTQWIKDTWPGVQVVPSLGNHDSFPKSQIPASGSPWLFDPVADIWASWLGPEATEQFRRYGYYQVLCKSVPDVRFVALHTTYWYKYNSMIPNSIRDPGGQITWLRSILDDARAANEAVIVTGHIPPGYAERGGDADYHSAWADQVIEVLSDYSDVVRDSMWGHLHSDSFRLLGQAVAGGPPTATAWLAPALTPWNSTDQPSVNGNNPAWRVFEWTRAGNRPGTFTALHQWWADLRTATSAPLGWRKEYSAPEDWGVIDLSPASVASYWYKMVTDTSVYTEYLSHNGVGLPQNYAMHGCGAGTPCKIFQLCALRYADSSLFSSCVAAGGPHLDQQGAREE